MDKTTPELYADFISEQADRKSDGSKPRNTTERKLARMAPPYNKITERDRLKAIGVVEDFDDEDVDNDNLDQLDEDSGATIPIVGAGVLGAIRGIRAIGGAIGDYVDNSRANAASERARFNRAQDHLEKVQKRNKNRMTSIDPADRDPNTGKVIDRRAGGGSDTPLSGIFHVSSGRDRGYHGFYTSPDGKSGGHVKVLVPANQSGNAEKLIRRKMADHTHLTKSQREEVTNAIIAHAKSQSPGQAVAEQYAAYISSQDRRNLFEAKDKPQDPADYAEFSNVRRGRNPESQYAHTDPIDKYIRDNRIKNTHEPDDLYHEEGPENLKEFPGVMTVHGEFGDEGPDAPVSYYRVHKSVLAKHPDLHKMLQAMDSQAIKQNRGK